MEKIIGKVIRVKIVKKQEKYYIGMEEENNSVIYIEDEGEFWEEELIDTYQRCIITEVHGDKIIGCILSNRKFLLEMLNIEKELKEKGEYDNVVDIYLMERLKINGKMIGLYMVDKGEACKYYLGTKEIGFYNKRLHENNILFKQNTIENELQGQIRDVVMSIDLSKKEISLEQEDEKLKEQACAALEMDRQQMKKMATIELNQKISEQKVINPKLPEKEELRTTKDINIKQELRTNDMMTDMKTLGQELEKNKMLPHVEGKKFTKIGIVESDHRDELVNEKGENVKANTTRYSFVAISSDGSVVPLNLEQDHQEGNNPREQNLQVSREGVIKSDDVLSRYNLGSGSLAIKNGKYGEIQVYHSPRKTIGGGNIEGNKSLDRQLETRNVWSMKKPERDLAGDFEDGYRSVEEGYQEAEKHRDKDGKLDEKHLTIDDVDGEKNTKSHEHDHMNYDVLAAKWGCYYDGKPDADKAQQLFEEKRKANPNKEAEEVVKMVSEELEEQYRKGVDRER